MTSHLGNTELGVRDALGVSIHIGDSVRVVAWGHPVRLVDTGRTAKVTGRTGAGNVVLVSDHDLNDPIARGRAVSPGVLAVARRDGQPGYEGNAATRSSTDIDSQLDALAAEARGVLARTPGQPTHAEVVAEVFRAMVARFGGGYHPDTASDGYESYPPDFDAELVSAVEDIALEAGLDLCELALEAAACYHPLSCSACNGRGLACGSHSVGMPGHDRCGRRR